MLVAAGFCGLNVNPAIAEDAAPALLSERQAECLAAQADAYLSEKRPVYVVIVPPEEDCPNPPSKTTDLAGKSTASGAGIGLKKGDSSGFIIMTYTQVACLKTNLKDVLKQDSQAPGKFQLVLADCPK